MTTMMASLFQVSSIALPSHAKLGMRTKQCCARKSSVKTTAAISTQKLHTVEEAEADQVTWGPGSGTDFSKGWTNANGMVAVPLMNTFEKLSVIASDRTEMHTILAVQRDNWNSLFHTTITIASVSAAAASAMNGAAPALGLKMVSIVLGIGAAALMALVSKFQPSQLAEEQRHAARFFNRFGADIQATLQVAPQLREDASSYWERKISTLHALDNAFPLPLTPIVLPKFPKRVYPSKLNGDESLSHTDIDAPIQSSLSGWTLTVVEDLKRTAQLLRSSDVPTYVEMAKNAKNINLLLSVTSPLFATAGVLLNLVGVSPAAAAVTVVALFAHTMTHALQMGAVYEVYRNCAGYYADVEDSIEESLLLPVEKREDATVFLQRISLLLGRTPAASPIVPTSHKTAGILF